jgi:hypothetical protein
MNRNYKERLDIPVGPDNRMEPGPDRGQPTHFLPRRHKNVFAVVVNPKTFGDQKIVWTLTIRGSVEKVAGSLHPDWQVDVASDSTTGNTPPRIEVTAPATVALAAPATLTAHVTDDGIPKPRRTPDPVLNPDLELNFNSGLTVEWSKYRGPGGIVFEAERQSVTAGTVTTTARFTQPGEYIIQAVADDGSRMRGYHCCWTNAQIKVTVEGAAAAGNRR